MNKISYKNIEINLDDIICTIDNNPIKLSKIEFTLLNFLLRNRNKFFNRKEIINNVWHTKVSLQTVDVTISRLRKKLGDYGKYIITRMGFGYGFIEK
jgi:two-component system, OmpR family, alkaline phosphatase synthesis response regulator PhoP